MSVVLLRIAHVAIGTVASYRREGPGLAWSCQGITMPSSTIRPAHWKSAAGRRRYTDAYNSALELWPVPFESLSVSGPFGKTHVVASGPTNAPPLVALHAATGFGALQWYANAAELSRDHRLYAIEYIGSAGKGTQSRPILGRAQCAEWLIDVFDSLELLDPPIAGSSQGGWLALNLALLQPSRVGALAMLAPAAGILPIRLPARLFIRLGPHMPAWTAAASFKAMLGNRAQLDGKLLRLAELHLEHFAYQDKAPFPTAFPRRQLETLRSSALLHVGDKEKIYSPSRVIAKARATLPDVTAHLVPNCGHLINIEQPSMTNERLIEFLKTQAGRVPPTSTNRGDLKGASDAEEDIAGAHGTGVVDHSSHRMRRFDI